jgi:myosin heavy subunit
LTTTTQYAYLTHGVQPAGSEVLGTAAHMNAVRDAFRVLKLEQHVPSILRVLAAVLLLGNVGIVAAADEFASVPDGQGTREAVHPRDTPTHSQS